MPGQFNRKVMLLKHPPIHPFIQQLCGMAVTCWEIFKLLRYSCEQCKFKYMASWSLFSGGSKEGQALSPSGTCILTWVVLWTPTQSSIHSKSRSGCQECCRKPTRFGLKFSSVLPVPSCSGVYFLFSTSLIAQSHIQRGPYISAHCLEGPCCLLTKLWVSSQGSHIELQAVKDLFFIISKVRPRPVSGFF